MDRHDWLAEGFEANRGPLRAVAHRMLGSLSEADDVLSFTIARGKIVGIDVIADRARLGQLDLAVLDDRS